MKYKIGDLVKVTATFLGEPAGVRAVVYELYNLGNGHRGISLMTENGVDLGGFGDEEAKRWVVFLAHTDFEYDFKNVVQLDRDWAAGVFKGAFK